VWPLVAKALFFFTVSIAITLIAPHANERFIQTRKSKAWKLTESHCIG
jgi:hypothetical protein